MSRCRKDSNWKFKTQFSIACYSVLRPSLVFLAPEPNGCSNVKDVNICVVFMFQAKLLLEFW